jgi:hypothetical protein
LKTSSDDDETGEAEPAADDAQESGETGTDKDNTKT